MLHCQSGTFLSNLSSCSISQGTPTKVIAPPVLVKEVGSFSYAPPNLFWRSVPLYSATDQFCLSPREQRCSHAIYTALAHRFRSAATAQGRTVLQQLIFETYLRYNFVFFDNIYFFTCSVFLRIQRNSKDSRRPRSAYSIIVNKYTSGVTAVRLYSRSKLFNNFT